MSKNVNKVETSAEKKVRTISFEVYSGIVKNICEPLFTKSKDGSGTTFNFQFVGIVKDYIKLACLYQELELQKKDLFTFYDGYVNGEYDVQLEEIEDNRCSKLIDESVDIFVKYRMYQLQSPILNALTDLVNVMNKFAEKFSDDFSQEDFKKMIGDFANFTQNVNNESLTETIIKKHMVEDKAV